MMDTQAIPAQAMQVVEALPPVAAIVLGGLAVVGLILWLMGRSLAKPACAVSGLVMGGIVGYVVGQALSGEGAMTLPLVIGGAIAGALLAALLFRVWMGVTGAAILALAVPAAVIIWQGTPISLHVTRAGDAPPPAAQAAETKVEMEDTPGDGAASAGMPPMTIEIEVPRWPPVEEPEDAPAKRLAKAGKDTDDEAASLPSGPFAALSRVAAGIYDRQATAIAGWWGQLGSGSRWLLGVAALVGAGIGLVLGLSAPNIAASLQTALVGSVLLFFPLRELAETYAPGAAGFMPTSPRATLVSLGLITLLGVLVQWAMFRRRAD